MEAFREWLIEEERQAIDPAVVQSYDRAFQAELEKLIQRAGSNLPLQRSLEAMRQCPVRTASGCAGWTNYIVGALLRNCPRTVDVDQAVNYIIFRMLGPRGERGEPRKTLFDLDTAYPYDTEIGSPLTARFKTFLMNDIRSVCAGKIRRLMAIRRPPGTISIAQGHRQADHAAGTTTADEIPDRHDPQYEELLADITGLLARQSTPDLPLLAVFQGMLRGENLRSLRTRIGYTRANTTRKAVYQVIEDYAARTDNFALRNLLAKYRDNKPDSTAPHSRFREKRVNPLAHLPPDVRDYISILQVVEAAGGRATMALLGKQRSRWLGRRPRNPASQARTRLHDVLENMVRESVLTKQGATYALGPNSGKYLELHRQATAAVPVGA